MMSDSEVRASEAEKSEVGEQIEIMSELINKYTEICEVLNERLTYVLKQCDPVDSGPDAPIPDLVPLAADLYGYNTRLRITNKKLEDILFRISL